MISFLRAQHERREPAYVIFGAAPWGPWLLLAVLSGVSQPERSLYEAPESPSALFYRPALASGVPSDQRGTRIM